MHHSGRLEKDEIRGAYQSNRMIQLDTIQAESALFEIQENGNFDEKAMTELTKARLPPTSRKLQH